MLKIVRTHFCSWICKRNIFDFELCAFMRILVCFFLCCAFSCDAQLVNIESQRMQTDTIRAAGNASVNYSYQKTNGISSSHFKTSASLQLKSKSLKNIFLILGSYDLAKSFGMTSNNAGFAHIRYNYKINPWLRWEVYTQLQFNELLSLKTRALTGTGARFKINKGKSFKMYLGLSAFYEYEEVRDPQFTASGDMRFSSYGVISWKLPNNLGEFTSVTYYQPSLFSLSDFRINSQNALVLKLTKHIAFTTQFNYFTDSNPPNGVDREVISLENGLRFTL